MCTKWKLANFPESYASKDALRKESLSIVDYVLGRVLGVHTGDEGHPWYIDLLQCSIIAVQLLSETTSCTWYGHRHLSTERHQFFIVEVFQSTDILKLTNPQYSR